MKNQLQNHLLTFFYTLGISIIITLILISIEQIYRFENSILSFNLTINSFAELLLINFFILTLSNKKTIISIYLFLMTLFFIQMLHFSYYGSWIFPLEYLLFFTKFSETMETFVTVLEIVIIPLILILSGGALLFWILSKMRSNRLKIPYIGYIWIALIIFIPARVWINDSNKGGKTKY